VTTVVLGSCTAVCEAVIASLHLQHAAACRLDRGYFATDRYEGAEHPELAIIVEPAPPLAMTAIAAVKHRWRGARVLVVGIPDQEDAILGCIGAGADGILSSAESLEQLGEAARRVHANGFRLPTPLLRPLLQHLIQLQATNQRPPQPHPQWAIRMSHRETEILGYVAQGKSNKEIAAELSVEEQTIKNHVTHILRKLGARSRFDAARLAPQYCQ
jgi:DNA-binding NarL/FixJ family response regulator